MTAAIAAAGTARPGPRPWDLEKRQGGYLINRTGGARAYCSLYLLEFHSEASESLLYGQLSW